ncbi:MAG: hypothetical protein KAV82_09275 [Phycisphaerae bacterium]|nr:hypothetical protein [Phycisphaerae bacterium]
MVDGSPKVTWAGALGYALGFMCPGRRVLAEDGAGRACHWFVPLGLIIGLAYTGVYRAVWRQFGEVSALALMPAAAVWLVDVAIVASALYLAAAGTIARTIHPSTRLSNDLGDRNARYTIEILALLILVVLKLVLLIAIPKGVASWPGPGDWRSHFNWMYAHPHYRPLILAPMWGRWAMLLVGSIGRLRDGNDAGLSRFCGSLSATLMLVYMIPIAVLTAIFCGHRGRWMFGGIISCVVLAGTYLYGVISARRQGGRTRDSIVGAGLIGELIFLIAYEAFAMNIYAP